MADFSAAGLGESMFKELMPIIVDRPLTITVAYIRDGRIKLCVVPHSHEKDEAINKRVANRKEVPKISDQAVKALSTPLATEGSPDELDAELPQQLTSYVEAHVTLQHGIADATQRINAALNEIEEREKSKAKAKSCPASANKKDAGQEGGRTDEKRPADATLPLDWCTPQTTAAASDTGDKGNGGGQ
jgi:PRTRC genetic system protein E